MSTATGSVIAAPASPATPSWSPVPPATRPLWPERVTDVLEGAGLALLLAIASTFAAGSPGYRFGDSNHGITVPILKRLMDPSLYPGDAMVATAERFPTVFYRVLGWVLPGTEWIPAAFFGLYLVAVAATLAGAYRIGRWAGGPAAGVLCLLFAFPVRIGLAGEALYRVAFSHSHLASALTIWAIVWFLEGRRLLPLLVLSLGAYVHLLYSAYVLVPMLLVVAFEARAVGTRETARRVAAAVVPLLPLAAWTLARGTPMTAEWLALLRLRSSHHSFPSAFGADLPEAAALLALSVLFASRLGADRRVVFALFVAGVAVQFVLGTVFTEFVPLKAVLQYQPHRAWRFLLLILRAAAAAGIVMGFRAGGQARVAAVFTGGVLLVPGLEPLLPLAVILQAAMGEPRPAGWALATAAAVLATGAGWNDREITYTFPAEILPRLLHDIVLGCAAVALVSMVARGLPPRRRAAAAAAVLIAALLWLGPRAYRSHQARWESGSWRAAQDWVRLNTPRAAVILTPPREAGFRVFSERTIVGEWKDGTQQYFDDGFVREWGARMEALGDDLAPLPEAQLVALADRYGAGYIVMARRPKKALRVVYRNPSFVVYAPTPAAPATD